jgi:hypothetical protein
MLKYLNISVEKGVVGAGAGAGAPPRYGSGSTKIMSLIWAPE